MKEFGKSVRNVRKSGANFFHGPSDIQFNACFLTCLLPLTPEITTFCSLVYPPGLAFVSHVLIDSWFITSPRLSHLTSVIITTLIIHHPIIVLLQRQNFSFSQILSSIDIWHLFGLISCISGLVYVFFSFQFFSSFSYRYFLHFSYSITGLL